MFIKISHIFVLVGCLDYTENVNCVAAAKSSNIQGKFLLGFKAEIPLYSTKVEMSSGDGSESCHNTSVCQRNLIFQAFCVPLLSCVPWGRQLSTVLATAVEDSGAEEIAHFNRPVTSVFRTCGRLLLPACESTDPKRMWQAVISLGKAAKMWEEKKKNKKRKELYIV